MPRKTVQPPVFDKDRNRWRVTIPAGLNPEGKQRVRSWHLTRDAARDYVARIVSGPEPSAVIPPKLAMKADEARLILEPYGLDLVEAAKMVASVMDTLGKSGTPLEAGTITAAATINLATGANLVFNGATATWAGTLNITGDFLAEFRHWRALGRPTRRHQRQWQRARNLHARWLRFSRQAAGA